MTHPHSASPLVPADIPDSFFVELPTPTLPRAHNGQNNLPSAHNRAMVIYDAIIDDILAHPGTSMSATAGRMGKGPNYISLIVRSDFFKARWNQRREKYNEELNFKLTAKLSIAADKAVEAITEALATRASIPLPVLNETVKTLFDRLGYAPQSGAPSVTVAVQQNNNTAAGNAQASPQGLERAREFLRQLEEHNASSAHRPGNGIAQDHRAPSGPVVEGEVVRERPDASST